MHLLEAAEKPTMHLLEAADKLTMQLLEAAEAYIASLWGSSEAYNASLRGSIEAYTASHRGSREAYNASLCTVSRKSYNATISVTKMSYFCIMKCHLANLHKNIKKILCICKNVYILWFCWPSAVWDSSRLSPAHSGTALNQTERSPDSNLFFWLKNGHLIPANFYFTVLHMKFFHANESAIGGSRYPYYSICSW